jgi:general stress protein 26
VAEKTDYFKEYWSTPEDPTYALLEFHILNIEYMKPGGMYAKKFKK